MPPTSMKPAVITGFGCPEVFQVAQKPVPVLKANQVLICTHVFIILGPGITLASATAQSLLRSKWRG